LETLVKITVDVPMPKDFRLFEAKVREAARNALVPASQMVQSNVINLTPRWKGGLQSRVLVRPENGGDQQVVYGTGVVMHVMENWTTWSKWPPQKPILDWVTGKLGLSGKKADSVAFLIRRKIGTFGLPIPLIYDNKGKMFKRTYELMAKTKAHFLAFAAAFKSKI
jgi:hypothetical protein